MVITPTGEFVPERVWSCPVHDYPDEHHCDCDLCTWEEPECCAGADWVDRLDADGNVVMRELTPWDLMFREMLREEADAGQEFIEALSRPNLTWEWREDEMFPRTGGIGG